MQVASPDEVVHHRPLVCGHCQQPLEGIAGQVKERRQIHYLSQVRLVVREHQVEEVGCPACQQVARGSFPTGVEAAVQYGPNLRALAVHVHKYQLVPLGRVSELLSDLYACQVSEGTLVAWVELAAERLAPLVAQIADWPSVGSLQHADETGVRIGGKRH
jgi:transposase